MKIRKLAAVSALTIAALGVAGGTAYADPSPAPAVPAASSGPLSPVGNDDATTFMNFVAAQALNPSAQPAGQSATLNTPIGSLSVDNGRIQASAASGQVVGSVPLAPVTDIARAAGRPELLENAAQALATDPVAATRPVPVTPVLDYGWKTEGEREQWAFKRAQDTVALTATTAAAIGAVGGGVVGCGIGAIAGVATGPFVLLGAPIATCLAGAAAGAVLGGLVTSAVVTIPVAIAAGVGYFNTINAPFVPPKTATPAK